MTYRRYARSIFGAVCPASPPKVATRILSVTRLCSPLNVMVIIILQQYSTHMWRRHLQTARERERSAAPSEDLSDSSAPLFLLAHQRSTSCPHRSIHPSDIFTYCQDLRRHPRTEARHSSSHFAVAHILNNPLLSFLRSMYTLCYFSITQNFLCLRLPR